MAIGEITNPYEFFTNADGTPLDAGQIYIGVYGLDPQDNPQAAYFDLAGTIGATQPIRTSGGYPVNAGSAAQLFVNGDYSIKVLDENNNLVYSALSVKNEVSDISAELAERALDYGPRNATNAAKLAANDDGTIGWLGGLQYLVDSTATGSNSATNDLGVSGLVPFGALDVKHFGAPADGTNSDQAAFEAWADYLNGSDHKEATIPARQYVLDGEIGLTRSNVKISAYGCLFKHSSNNACFDMNGGALPDESEITYAVRWFGGEFSFVGTGPTGTISVSGVSGTFRDGERLTASPSGMEVWLSSISGTTMTVADHSGTIASGQTLTGEISGATATVSSFTAGNTAVAIRANGLTRSSIQDVFFREYGRAAIETAAKESMVVHRCSGFNCARYVYVPEYLTTSVANPQVVTVSESGFSKHYVAAIHVLGAANAFKVENGFTIGSNAVVIANRFDGDNGQEVSVDGTTFEQGVAGIGYIQVLDSGAGTLQNMSVTDCGFGSLKVGGGATIAEIARVSGFTFAENYVPTAADGWLSFDTNCTDVQIGRNQIITAGAITYDCDRSELSMWPYSEMLAVSRGVIDNAATYDVSDGSVNETIDVSALNFTAKTDARIAMLPPIGYDVVINAKDTESATDGSNIWSQLVTDTSVTPQGNAAGFHVSARLDDHPDTARVQASGYVAADVNGDIAKQVQSSSAGTLTNVSKITKIHW